MDLAQTQGVLNETPNWRSEFFQEIREKVILQITIQLGISNGSDNSHRSAALIEEEIYNSAISLEDYAKKICAKLRELLTRAYRSRPVNSSISTDTSGIYIDLASGTPSATADIATTDWQAEAYKKIKSLKDRYFEVLKSAYEVHCWKLNQMAGRIMQGLETLNDVAKLILYKMTFEHLIEFLQRENNLIIKNEVEIISVYEMCIVSIVAKHRSYLDTQEEDYQKILSLKDKYFSALADMHSKVTKLAHQAENTVATCKHISEKLDKITNLELQLEFLVSILQSRKGFIAAKLKNDLPQLEKQIASAAAEGFPSDILFNKRKSQSCELCGSPILYMRHHIDQRILPKKKGRKKRTVLAERKKIGGKAEVKIRKGIGSKYVLDKSVEQKEGKI